MGWFELLISGNQSKGMKESHTIARGVLFLVIQPESSHVNQHQAFKMDQISSFPMGLTDEPRAVGGWEIFTDFIINTGWSRDPFSNEID